MRQQHLLSINFHIIYKLLVNTHFVYHHKTPTYLAKLIKPYSSLRVQRTYNLHQIKNILTYKQNSHLSIHIINIMSHEIGNINKNMDKYIQIMFKI